MRTVVVSLIAAWLLVAPAMAAPAPETAAPAATADAKPEAPAAEAKNADTPQPAKTDVPVKRWIPFYSDKITPDELMPYDVIVLDPQYHPPLRPLMNRGKKLLAYLSLGEAETGRGRFDTLNAHGLLMHENPDWPGARVIDVRSPKWAAMVVEEVIPELLRMGFDGIMIDTIDSPVGLGMSKKPEYEGMKEAAIRLVRHTRMHYPNITIMLNRSLDILPEVATDIDMVLAESIYIIYDFKKKEYNPIRESWYESIVELMDELKKKNPALEVYSLDYWPQDDAVGRKKIYEKQRASGFVPYVGTLDLHTLVPEE